MTDCPLISVIIPIHNGEKWIKECFESILKQDILERERIEISVYNDFSTDNTIHLLSEWEEEISKISNLTIVVGSNIGNGPGGVGFAKNRAVEQSSGKYLCFQDVDDIMLPKRITQQLGEVQKHPEAIIGCQVRRIPEDSTPRLSAWANNLPQHLLTTQIYTSHGPTVLMPTWFLERKVYEKAGPFSEEGRGTPEDLLFFYSHLDAGGTVRRVDEVLLIYRYHPSCTTFSIDEGKFGTVYKCKEKSTGLLLAAKIVPTSRKEDKRNVEREIDIMRTLQHPRLIQLYDAFEKDKTMVVVLELIEGGELFERVIGDDFVLTEKSCTAFMRQICEGMEFIHQNNILHLDMKPENILCLTKTGNRIKIIDFGLARKFDPDKKLQVLFGTPEFVAPEVVNFDRIGFGTDMWSIGVICYVLLSGLSPFMGETDIETMANVTVSKWDFDDEAFLEISDDAKDFISNLLVKDKEKRLTATQCLAHPWLRRKPPVPVQKQPSVVKVESPRSELDLAKDNLKFFVERWNEHPNSPYIFDTSCQTISPCVSFNNIPDQRSRTPSLSGYSPSPCDSISSLVDAVVSESPPVSPKKSFMINNNNHLRSNDQSPTMSPRNVYLDRLQIFDRRASDSSWMMRNSNDVASRINLADEIKKLSDKLLKINNLQNLENHLNNNDEAEYSLESEIDNDHVKVSSTTKIGGKHSKFENQTQSTANFGTEGRNSFFYSTTTSSRSTVYDNSHPKSFLDLATPRRKFKFSNRDVPIQSTTTTTTTTANNSEGENLSDTTSSTLSSAGHSNPSTPDLFPETPDLAKNILQLLGKYEDFRPKSELRRTSLSMDWSEVETLGQRTMKSLSNFIQTTRNADPKRKTTFKTQ